MKIAIAGGSIAGLASAVTLNCIGHDVVVHECRDRPLPDPGGGVADAGARFATDLGLAAHA
ncbi:hypothetical protein [Burkholderia diffusa]|uniref:Monooxygenase n=1 Tax=Burkholderia diffusa TaxID=488732 RepID=A0A6P2NGN0_9BURK|nr:hypothetical protein [Burkholderia diffusa]KAB0662589.1 hypothetical protein F7R23_01740 [Burkholderia diffusa]MBM2654988.1 hypothetical protein [Burkholderia diffusa]VWB90742.1 hypothetical protein BDI24065_04361 [Burkholderia diffusa]